jgi:hypothetical protein
MHDALDMLAARRRPAPIAVAVRAARPQRRRPLLRKAFDDWEGTRDRCLARA